MEGRLFRPLFSQIHRGSGQVVASSLEACGRQGLYLNSTFPSASDIRVPAALPIRANTAKSGFCTNIGHFADYFSAKAHENRGLLAGIETFGCSIEAKCDSYLSAARTV